MAEEHARKKWEDMERGERQDAMRAYHQLLRADFGRPPKNALGQPMISAEEWVNAEGPLATSRVQSEELRRDEELQSEFSRKERERKTQRDQRDREKDRERDVANERKYTEDTEWFRGRRGEYVEEQERLEENLKEKINTVLAIVIKSQLIAQNLDRDAWVRARGRFYENKVRSLQTKLESLTAWLVNISDVPSIPEQGVNNMAELQDLERKVAELKVEANELLIQQQQQIMDRRGDEVLADILKRVQEDPISDALARGLIPEASRLLVERRTHNNTGGGKTRRSGRKKATHGCGCTRGGRRKKVTRRCSGSGRGGRRKKVTRRCSGSGRKKVTRRRR